tara:strand:+ start:806 stop:1621 length:816 start_codon:yes stop_codon:yes gene_type:complete
MKRPNKIVIAFFIFIHLGALLAFIPGTFCWSAVALMIFMHWLTASVGICLGFHRYLTHRAVILPKWLDYIITTIGTLACQNGPINWVAHHRMHHGGSDTSMDPHNASEGFWWSHIGWMCYTQHKFDHPARITRFARDISDNRYYQFLDKHFILLQIGLAILFYLLGGVSWVVWGIFVRLVLVYHSTWFVNSACHIFGYKNFKLDFDRSTNCWWSAILSYGEGWHNNHHADPKRANNRVKAFEIDPTFILITILKKLGCLKLARRRLTSIQT